MSVTYWQGAKRGLLSLSLLSGLAFGCYLMLTPVLGEFSPFDGLEWTGVGVLWIVSVLWEYTRIDW